MAKLVAAFNMASGKGQVIVQQVPDTTHHTARGEYRVSYFYRRPGLGRGTHYRTVAYTPRNEWDLRQPVESEAAGLAARL